LLTKATQEGVGTIASINVAAKTVTLAANTSTAIAVGDKIVGASDDIANIGEPYGIIISLIDITDTSDDVACYTSASVFAARLPYWDAAMQTKFPEITLVDPVVP
jgi:hypothetical protein